MFDHGVYQRIMGLDLTEYLLADRFSATIKEILQCSLPELK